MRRFPKLAAFVTGLLGGFATLVAGGAVSGAIGDATHSGMLGICGPYGPHADLVGFIFLGSIPVGIVVGVLVGRGIYRYLGRNEKKN